MRSMAKAAWFVFLMLMSREFAIAQDLTVEKLANRCEAVKYVGEQAPTSVAVERVENIAFCRGYLGAVFHQTIAGTPVLGALICIKPGAVVTEDQIAKIFVKYADQHPAKLGEPAFEHATLAFMESFPCK